MTAQLENASPAFWNEYNSRRRLQYNPKRILFKEVFDRHLPKGGSCLEIGCYPGDYLIYLGKTFDLEANGIDTTPGSAIAIPSYIASHAVRVGTVWEGDFLNTIINRRFSVVCSFGFVEHFVNFPEIICLHAERVEKGGLLFVSCPNFRNLQYLYHYMFDWDNLQRHVLGVMRPLTIAHCMKRCGLHVLESGYYRTIELWEESSPKGRVARKTSRAIKSVACCIQNAIDIPNSLTSPYLYCIARKD